MSCSSPVGALPLRRLQPRMQCAITLLVTLDDIQGSGAQTDRLQGKQVRGQGVGRVGELVQKAIEGLRADAVKQ